MRFAKWIFSLILVFVLVSCEKSATYKVLFETNSDLILSTVEVENNKKLEEPNQLVKEGYEFLGWYTDIDFSSKWDFEKNAVKSNLVLYAKWEKLTFEVSFDVDGGSTVEPKTIGYDEFISKPKNPTKEGYSFDGWFKDEEYQEEWDFLADSIRAKTIIYAKWIEREFVVSFNTLDGKDGEELYLDYNSLIPEPSLPSRTGHVFLGWFKAIDYEEEWDFNNDVVKADTILYAKWDPALFTVSFENVEDYETKTIEYGKLIARPEEPTKANHRFGGWFIDDELKIAWNFEAPILKNMILYAKWTELQGATIYGNRDLEIRLEELENLDFSVGVIAKDDSGEDLTSEIVIDTSGIKAEPGVYEINYSVTDGAGSITKVTSMLTIQEATRKEPYLDTRDFESKESRIANTVVNVDYSYDEIIYTVDVYEGYGQNGRLQVLKNIEGYFEKGKKYVVSLVAQASKKTKIQPYLQKDPVKSPWTNVMANPYFEVDEEPRVIQFVFELEEVFDIYVFSIEFGNAFENGESGWMIFRDIKFFEYDDSNEVSFTLNGGVGATKQYVEEDGRFSVADPVRRGFSFEGWYADEELETVWDYNNLVTEDTTLYAKWAGLNAPEIYDYQDLELRLEELAGFDYLANIKAHDALDGDISGEISVDVDEILEEAGVYEIVYSVTNSQEVTTTKTVTVTVLEATKELPYLDNRDFFVDYQNLSEPQIYAIFGYDEIVYRVTAFRPSGTAKNNMVQIATVLTDVLKPNTTYTFSFDVKAPKAGSLQPYLQKYPKDKPYTNLFDGETHVVGAEYSTVSTTFTTGDTVDSDYSLSIEFGTLFTNSSNNSSVEYIYFKNIQMIENKQ